MMTSLDNLQRYKMEGEALLEWIVTGDETWVDCYQPESKQASNQWKHKELPTPTTFKVLLSERKVMVSVFWDMKGVLLVEFQPGWNCTCGICLSNSKLQYETNKKDCWREEWFFAWQRSATHSVGDCEDCGQPGVRGVTTSTIQLGFSAQWLSCFWPDEKMLGGQKFASDMEVQWAIR